MHEEPLIMKLGLSRKFPRHFLRSRKSVLGVGIMMPKAMIAILKAKKYLRNIRRRGETNNSMLAQHELMTVEAGSEVSIGYDPKEWH